MKTINRTYYTLNDLYKSITGEEIPAAAYLNESFADDYKLKVIIENLLIEPSSTSIVVGGPANTLWENYICPRNAEEYIGYGDNVTAVGLTFIKNYLTIFKRTYERYVSLIDMYEDEAGNLMNDIKATTTSRFNDTPQNSGTFGDDSHTTNITQSTTSTEGATKMARLNEIRDSLYDMYSLWALEFDRLFITSAEAE